MLTGSPVVASSSGWPSLSGLGSEGPSSSLHSFSILVVGGSVQSLSSTLVDIVFVCVSGRIS